MAGGQWAPPPILRLRQVPFYFSIIIILLFIARPLTHARPPPRALPHAQRYSDACSQRSPLPCPTVPENCSVVRDAWMRVAGDAMVALDDVGARQTQV